MSKKILITSALPYVNNVPHLGNMIGSTLSADVFARFSRMVGRETLFICGADEHGTATETKAREEGVTPQELCDKYFAIHKEIYDWFAISFDKFGRTSKDPHGQITTDLFNKVLEHGYITQKTVIQPYSPVSQTFLADRFVVGTCPHCGYEDARGDQCDACGKLLDPKELINPRSAVDGSTPEFRETNHLFLSLDKLQPLLENWIKKQSKDGNWTDNSVQITKSWLKEGLQPRAISRDLKWGINIPQSAFGGQYKDKVFYVWFDAPIGYISITAQHTDDWQSWWKNPQGVDLYQFMGKDNVPFHSIIFPATLLAAQDRPDEYTMVHHLSATEYLNYEGGKFSKSRGIGVFGDNAKESGIPADVFRYVLLYNRPEGSDTQFTWKGLQERLNNELVANFGNLVNRALTFTDRFFEGKVATVKTDDAAYQAFVAKYVPEIDMYISLLEQVRLRDALMQFMKISSLANQFFQDAQPWKVRTEDEAKARQDLAVLVNIIADLAFLVQPYMPHVSTEIFRQLNIKPIAYDQVGKFTLGEFLITKPEVLFTKLEDKDVEELKRKYGVPEKKEKQQQQDRKNSSEKEKEVAAQTPSIAPLQPSDVIFRVGRITDIKKHEKADKLYVEQVDMGGGVTKQIVSGLVAYYAAEELLGKHIVVVDNLKPAQLRGQLSEGMVLAAEDEQGTVGLVFAPDSEPGTVFTGEHEAKDEITFEEFMTLDLQAKDGKVLVNGSAAQLSDGNALIIDRVRDGKIR